jgi:hypothetical protein
MRLIEVPLPPDGPQIILLIEDDVSLGIVVAIDAELVIAPTIIRIVHV